MPWDELGEGVPERLAVQCSIRLERRGLRELLAAGTPEEIAGHDRSVTGQFLQDLLPVVATKKAVAR